MTDKLHEDRGGEASADAGVRRKNTDLSVQLAAPAKPKPEIIRTYRAENGHIINVYRSGMEFDTATGRAISPPLTAPITSANAREMRARGVQLARERAVAGIDQAAIEAGLLPKTATKGEGWRAVVQHVTEVLLKSENLRGQAEGAAFLAKASGYLSPETETTEFATEFIRALFELSDKFDRADEREVVDARVSDISAEEQE